MKRDFNISIEWSRSGVPLTLIDPSAHLSLSVHSAEEKVAADPSPQQIGTVSLRGNRAGLLKLAERFIAVALAETMISGENVLGRTIDEGTFAKRQLLLKETYTAYRELLAGDETAIERAEKNFARRRSDSYFAGGLQIEGGGLDNLHVIDYRLAAILTDVTFRTDSIHAIPYRE